MSEHLNEADTRAKLIDPAIHSRGWTEDLIRREVTAGGIEIIGNKAHRLSRGKMDYVLRIKVNPETQPVAVALIEAKKNSLPPGHGLTQAKGYAECSRLHVPFIFSSNGYQFVRFDRHSGITSPPKPMSEFPTSDDLRASYEDIMGFRLSDPVAKPLLQPYWGGEGVRRYYQDAAIRATIEKIAKCELNHEPKRILLSLATGAGKTFIAVNLLKKISDAGQLKRAMFVCDRDELRTQAMQAFQNVFGNDAAPVFLNSNGENNAKNARIHIATYQTLDVDTEEGNANFLTTFYPENYFTHIVIDECHRSAWGKWSQVLKRNDQAVHIGLTATPRKLMEKLKNENDEIFNGSRENRVNHTEYKRRNQPLTAHREFMDDTKICADNFKYFGEPVYEYDMAQAIEDGYLAACEIRKGRVNIDNTGISIDEIISRNPVDAITGETVNENQIRESYNRTDFENRILLPDRVLAMCGDLFQYLIETGDPEQKTIIYCARDRHADDVASTMNNIYSEWCNNNNKERLGNFAFKCTASVNGNEQLPDLRASSRSHFIATTVDLLTTGVDVPCVRNIVFFRYLKSPIYFHQIVGRGTRIDMTTGKLMFRVYDYTDVTDLFGREFITPPTRTHGQHGPITQPQFPTIIVEGFEVHITDAGRYIVAQEEGRAIPVPIEEYKARLAARLVAEAPTLESFRERWIDPPSRQELIDALVTSGYSPSVLRMVDEKEDYDFYDILAELGWGMNPRTRRDRALAFTYKHEDWLESFPESAEKTIRAIINQFERGGTEGLENPQIFQTPEVRASGGLQSLKELGNPAEILKETKNRMFAA